jgi:antitoxin (DNA-binding transcriptional repressor) of toxin-antitoxin stability system
MRQVRIAELKAKLSEFLRAVQGGESFAVLDRNTAIAQIVPLRERPGIRIRKPASGSPAPNKVPLPKPAQVKIDVLEAELTMATHDKALALAAQAYGLKTVGS